MHIVAVRSLGSSSDPHLEIAVHVELEDQAVAAPLVRRPRHICLACNSRVSGDPDVVLLVDINPVLTLRPDAACFFLTFAADVTGIRWATPSAQQFTVGIEFENRRSGLAAIRDGSIHAR